MNTWHLFNVAVLSLNHRLDTDPELEACLFHKRRREVGEYSADGGDQAGFGVVGVHVGDVLDIWPNKVAQRVQVGGSSERRVQNRSTPSEPKPRSLWTCRPAPRPAATPRVCCRPPDCTRGSPHASAHQGTLWRWLSGRLRRCAVTLKTITVAGNFVFIALGTFVAIQICILRVLAMVLPVITWIGREHELHSGASPISLVKHCVVFRYDWRLQSLLGFVQNWPTSRWSPTKKKTDFHLTERNHFIFSWVTILSFHPVYIPKSFDMF